jgi:hypothetical protein
LLLSDPEPARPGRCSALYERCIGYWDKHHERTVDGAPPLWDRNRSWSWQTYDDACPVADLLSASAGPLESAPKWFPRPGGLKVLFIGDSLDKHLMQKFCELDRRQLKLKWLVSNFSGAGTCTGGALVASNYRIFGLAAPSQLRLLPRYEKRQPSALHWDTRYRLEHLLLRDLPEAALPLDAIVLHSGVWDLSRPLTSTDPVPLSTALAYHAAVRDISKLMRRLFPRTLLFWRTGPPVGHHDAPPSSWLTRTHKSQATLHAALKDAVDLERAAGNVDSDVLDWFAMCTGYSHVTAADRIHYPPAVDLAFFNLFLNALRERMPGR